MCRMSDPSRLALAAKEQAYGKWWNFAGAGATTQREMAERIFAETGSKPKIMVAGKWMLRLAGLFNPFMREMVEMHYLLTTPVIMNDTALAELLGGLIKLLTPTESSRRWRRCATAARCNIADTLFFKGT